MTPRPATGLRLLCPHTPPPSCPAVPRPALSPFSRSGGNTAPGPTRPRTNSTPRDRRRGAAARFSRPPLSRLPSPLCTPGADGASWLPEPRFAGNTRRSSRGGFGGGPPCGARERMRADSGAVRVLLPPGSRSVPGLRAARGRRCLLRGGRLAGCDLEQMPQGASLDCLRGTRFPRKGR